MNDLATWISDEQTKRVAEIHAEQAKINKQIQDLQAATQAKLQALMVAYRALDAEMQNIKA